MPAFHARGLDSSHCTVGGHLRLRLKLAVPSDPVQTSLFVSGFGSYGVAASPLGSCFLVLLCAPGCEALVGRWGYTISMSTFSMTLTLRLRLPNEFSNLAKPYIVKSLLFNIGYCVFDLAGDAAGPNEVAQSTISTSTLTGRTNVIVSHKCSHEGAPSASRASKLCCGYIASVSQLVKLTERCLTLGTVVAA
jgi:hypothetical protein